MIRAVGLLAVALWPGVVGAATLTLTESQQQEAIQTGERSVTADVFDAEWRVPGAAGETAMVMTPFHRLAIAGRHAAFNGKPLKPGEPAKILKESTAKDRSRAVMAASRAQAEARRAQAAVQRFG